MERACYGYKGGKLVTVAEFLGEAHRNYKERGIYPYCPACGEVVELYGAHSPESVQRFDHRNASPSLDPADDCPLANRGDTRFKDLVPREWDFVAGEKIRNAFFEEEHLKRAYSFCLFFCGRRKLPSQYFNTLIRRADKRNIWCYAGIQLWMIPYVLLTLGDFRAVSEKSGKEYGYHFIFDKSHGNSANYFWRTPHESRLLRVFTGSNKLMHWPEIPCPLSEEKFIEIAGETEWIKPHLLRALMAAASVGRGKIHLLP